MEVITDCRTIFLDKKILKVRHKIKRALMDEVKKWIGRKIKKPTVFV